MIRVVIAPAFSCHGRPTPAIASWTMSGTDYIRRASGLRGCSNPDRRAASALHHPFLRFGAANSVTLVRVALVAGMAGLIGEPASERIGWLAVAGSSSSCCLDGVDGWLAREATDQRFGARFDMETDAALILILSLLVWQHGKAGVWVLACGLMRYTFVGVWIGAAVDGTLLSLTIRGKSVAVAQLLGLGAALSPLVPVPFSTVVAAVTLATLVWSFAVDVAWLKRQAR